MRDVVIFTVDLDMRGSVPNLGEPELLILKPWCCQDIFHDDDPGPVFGHEEEGSEKCSVGLSHLVVAKALDTATKVRDECLVASLRLIFVLSAASRQHVRVLAKRAGHSLGIAVVHVGVVDT